MSNGLFLLLFFGAVFILIPLFSFTMDFIGEVMEAIFGAIFGKK